MPNKEIEVKFIINNEIKNKIINVLNKIATRTGQSHLIDTYYIPNFKNFEINGRTIECLRIRENEKEAILSYKHIHYDADPVYCDEYESFVQDKNQIENILLALSFSKQMVIDKIRTTYVLNDLKFDFDSVKNLGELLEVELKNENGNIEDIFSFVNQFGLTKEDITYKGIQILMKEALK